MSLFLLCQVLVCDHVVFELRHGSPLPFEQAHFVEKAADPVHPNDVQDVLLMAETV